MIIFDTSAVIDFLHGGTKTKAVVEGTEAAGGEVGVTTITLFELMTPIHHRRLEKEEREVTAFFNRSTMLQLDEGSAQEASRAMGLLLRVGRPVNAFDALIAGIALKRGAKAVLTKDKDFEEIAKVVELKVQMI